MVKGYRKKNNNDQMPRELILKRFSKIWKDFSNSKKEFFPNQSDRFSLKIDQV